MNLKKIIAPLLAACLLFAVAGCKAKTPAAPEASPAPGDSMELSALMETILTDAPDLPGCADIEITDENFKAYLFIDPIEGARALASEALIGSIAHSAVLLRLPEGEDAAAVAKEIEANANPRKWICVEAEKTIVSAHNQTILLVMSFENTADKIAANFDAQF